MIISDELRFVESVLHGLIRSRDKTTPADMTFTLRAMCIRLRDARGEAEDMELVEMRRENARQPSLLPLMWRTEEMAS